MARPDAVGLDSVKIVAENGFTRTGHLYIRWHEVNPAAPRPWIIVFFLWPPDGSYPSACYAPWYPNPYHPELPPPPPWF